MADLIPRIHHERQEPDSMMCGQHAINNLLGGQYFQPTDLAALALQLDEEENGELNERRNESVNMDDSGFFSVQVLDRCLEVWNLSLTRWRAEEMASEWDRPEEQEAFILNLASHWFTLRRFGNLPNRWYNLNSFYATPQWVSGTYLSMVLNQAENEGYSVFVIRPRDASSASSTGSFLPSTAADEYAAAVAAGTITGSSHGDDTGMGYQDYAEDEDTALRAALAASLAEAPPSTSPPSSSSNIAAPQAPAASIEDDPVAFSLARAQARLAQAQREQADALRGDGDYYGGYEEVPHQARPALGSRPSRGENQASGEDDDDGPSGSTRRRGRGSRQADPMPIDVDDSDVDQETRPVAPLPGRRTRHDEDEEQLRLAIAASVAEQEERDRAPAGGEGGDRNAMDVESDEEEEDEELDNEPDLINENVDNRSRPRRPSTSPSPPSLDFLAPDRNYDDEDDELQRALQASLEGGDGWGMAVPPPKPLAPAAVPTPDPEPVRSEPVVAATKKEEEEEKESSEKEEEEEEEEEVLSPEEVRRRRLARFGGA